MPETVHDDMVNQRSKFLSNEQKKIVNGTKMAVAKKKTNNGRTQVHASQLYGFGRRKQDMNMFSVDVSQQSSDSMVIIDENRKSAPRLS